MNDTDQLKYNVCFLWSMSVLTSHCQTCLVSVVSSECFDQLKHSVFSLWSVSDIDQLKHAVLSL